MTNNHYDEIDFLQTKAWGLIKKEIDENPVIQKPLESGYFIGRLHFIHYPSRNALSINNKEVESSVFKCIYKYIEQIEINKHIIEDCKHIEEILK